MKLLTFNKIVMSKQRNLNKIYMKLKRIFKKLVSPSLSPMVKLPLELSSYSANSGSFLNTGF